jgi:MFS transporter, YNFM family, putative membrane transport protein
MASFMLGAAGMFAVTYSTQAILPAIGSTFRVSPSHAGLTVSLVVLGLAVGAPFWGTFSDRLGRKRSIVLASLLLVPPTVGTAVAPSLGALLAFRVAQGLCMPGLLTAGIPYVTEAFAPRIGGRAMGYYVTSLVAGGLVGRVGVALLASAVGWRTAIGLLAGLPLAAAALMQHTLLDLPGSTAPGGLRGLGSQLRNRALLQATIVGGAFFFVFVGTFSYVVYRLEQPPFDLGTAAGSLVFLLWVLGALAPAIGRLSDRVGWQRLALAALGLSAAGLALSLPRLLPTLVAGLALVTLANFGGVTAAQLGVSAAADRERGAATAVYFTLYYLAGSAGGYLPGLAWERFAWPGVAATGVAALVLATAVLTAPAKLLGRSRIVANCHGGNRVTEGG